MVSTFTPNIQLEEPARGDDVGVWDTPVNNNMTLIDSVVGNNVTISLNNSNVILNAAQFQSRSITFNSTLTGNVNISFPSSFKKDYIIYNACTGTSAFSVSMVPAPGGTQGVCAVPGEAVQIYNDGTIIKYVNLGRVGSYMDYAGSSVPNWITNCTIPPYLVCDGTAFSSATYPLLATILGGTTLPDFRGRSPFYYNAGTNRLTTGGAGIDGNTLYASGGNNGVTLAANQIPTLSGVNFITVFPEGNSGLFAPINTGGFIGAGISVQAANFVPLSGNGNTIGYTSSFSGSNTITVNTNPSPSIVPATIPGVVGGIRMIRAA